MNTKHIRACLFFILSFFLFFIFISCTGNPGSLADVAKDDSLCIDTVATLDEVEVPDTTARTDSVAADSL